MLVFLTPDNDTVPVILQPGHRLQFRKPLVPSTRVVSSASLSLREIVVSDSPIIYSFSSWISFLVLLLHLVLSRQAPLQVLLFGWSSLAPFSICEVLLLIYFLVDSINSRPSCIF